MNYEFEEEKETEDRSEGSGKNEEGKRGRKDKHESIGGKEMGCHINISEA